MKKLSKIKYLEFYIFSILLMVFALFLDSPIEIYQGLVKILTSPSILVSDYMQIGGVGASFMNAGFMLLISLIIAEKSGAAITGALIAGLFTLTGFSFFGKNILNSIPLMIGVYIYAKIKKLSIANYIHVLCFVTGISPLVSLFIFGLDFTLIQGVILGFLAGIIIGIIIVPISSNFVKFHDGYSLYNIGFTIGVIGIVFAGLLRMFNKEIPSISVIYEGNDAYAFAFILVFCLGLVIIGLIKNKGFSGYKDILNHSGRLITDYTIESNRNLVMINMGLTGLIAIIFVKLSNGIFNGPIIGGIFTIIGFAAFGKHPRNVLPIMMGVFLASNLNKYEPSSTTAVLTGLFSTTIAPLAGEFGFLAGIIAGFLHKAVATNTGLIHGGLNLYNNGLAGAFVAAVLLPIFRDLKERRERD
ncbi:DUF1576 domain-containing protein [Anaerococcus sp. ENR0831]|uniref:DUF1576 domain-containing protein n=1 Tax=Anaerococcus martiniensis TaxID=3115615 RepID=A0ABW9M6L6_9FIRM